MHVLKLVIRRHTHNFIERPRLPGGFVYAEPLAKRIRAFKNLADKRLIDDGYLARCGGVAVVEVPPGEERSSDGLEIARAKIIEPNDPCVCVGALKKDVLIPGAPAKGHEHRVSRGFHAGDRLDSLDKVAFILCKALLGKVQTLEIDASDQNSALLETYIQRRQVAQTSDKE